jgi:hypothetical protein
MTRGFAFPGASSTIEHGAHGLEAAAEEIAIARGECIAEALFHMAAIRSLQRAPGAAAALVTCSRAHVQDRSAAADNQAAHLLPGQILVQGKPVWLLAEEPPTGTDRAQAQRLSLRTQMTFARTNNLPAIFNNADSQAEQMAAEAGRGLKLLFADSVHILWASARVDTQRPFAVDRRAVLSSLGDWFTKVNGVYRSAAERKQLAAPSAGAKKSQRLEEARVLKVYADSFKVAADPSRFVRSHLGFIDQYYPTL